jgi:hypothetical protein
MILKLESKNPEVVKYEDVAIQAYLTKLQTKPAEQAA